MKWIGLALLLLPVAISEATNGKAWIDPATARIKAPRPDKSSWVNPATKRVGASKSQASCSACKACLPCTTAPTHFARLVRRMLIIFDGGTKKTETTPEGTPIESWEVFIRMEMTDQDKRFLRDFVNDQNGDMLGKTDFYDVSSALERIMDPANRVPRPTTGECRDHNEDSWEEFSFTVHAIAGRFVSVLSTVIGTAWTIVFNNATFEAFLVVSCGLSFYLMWKALAASWPWYHVAMLALFLGFFISYFWMYGQLYEAELLDRSRIMDAGTKFECAEKVSAGGPKWNQSVMNYWRSLVTWSSSDAAGNSKECRDYFDALYKNPLRKINPAYVFVQLMSLLLFEPMEKFGVNYGKFQAAIWQHSSWSSAVAASIIGPVILVVVILIFCGYEFNLPFFLGSVNPNRNTSAAGPPPLGRAASEPAVIHAVAASNSVHNAVMSGRGMLGLEETIEEERQVEEFRRELRRVKSQVENGGRLSYLDYTESSSAVAVSSRPARSVSVPHESFSRTYLMNGGAAVRQRRRQNRRTRGQNRQDQEGAASLSEPIPSGGVAVVSGGRPQPVDPRMREFIKEVITDCLERQKRQFVARTPSCDVVEELEVSTELSGNLEDDSGSDLSGGDEGTLASEENKENEVLCDPGNDLEHLEGKIEAGDA